MTASLLLFTVSFVKLLDGGLRLTLLGKLQQLECPVPRLRCHLRISCKERVIYSHLLASPR